MENSILVRNLPKDVYVPDLCDNFRCFGNILSATVYCDDNTQVIEAHIEFDEAFSALRAVESMHNVKLKNRPIGVSLTTESDHFKKVFVKNLNPTWDECDLLKVFEDIGTIEDARISLENGKSNGYGFVVFSSYYTAKRAIESMNGKEIDGRKLVVERFKRKSERDSLKHNSLEHVEKMLQQSAQLNNLYIKNLPFSMNEDQLKELFEKYGSIVSVKIAVDENGKSRQFGFVCFENKQDAEKARKRMNGQLFEGKTLQISFKEDGNLRKQYNSLKNKETDIKIKQYKQRAQSLPKLLPNSLSLRMASSSVYEARSLPKTGFLAHDSGGVKTVHSKPKSSEPKSAKTRGRSGHSKKFQ